MLEKQKAKEPHHRCLHLGSGFFKDLLKCVCIRTGVFYAKCGRKEFYSFKKCYIQYMMKVKQTSIYDLAHS